jgi:hypothetical protein
VSAHCTYAQVRCAPMTSRPPPPIAMPVATDAEGVGRRRQLRGGSQDDALNAAEDCAGDRAAQPSTFTPCP